jgi:predicted nucleic acid-binding protein
VGWAAAEADQGEGHGQRPRHRAATLIVYFDSSAFVKLVVEEPGSAKVATLWDSAERRVSSRLLYPESRAALGAARRTDRLGTVYGEARTALERLWSGIEDIAITPELARRAGDVADELALRGYDAVHLATAEAVLDDDGILAATDVRLAAAARSLGLALASL